MRPARQRGQSLTELAISLPVLLLLIALTIDFGRVYYFDLSIRHAAFAAARYGGMNPNDDAGIKNAAVTAAPAGVLDTSAVTVGGTAPRGSGTALQVTVTYTFRPMTPVISRLTGSSITLQRSAKDIVK
jgi:Flp pilus assembly protein TadG